MSNAALGLGSEPGRRTGRRTEKGLVPLRRSLARQNADSSAPPVRRGFPGDLGEALGFRVEENRDEREKVPIGAALAPGSHIYVGYSFQPAGREPPFPLVVLGARDWPRSHVVVPWILRVLEAAGQRLLERVGGWIWPPWQVAHCHAPSVRGLSAAGSQQPTASLMSGQC